MNVDGDGRLVISLCRKNPELDEKINMRDSSVTRLAHLEEKLNSSSKVFVVCTTCHATMSEGISVYRCSKWSHLQAE